MTPFFFNPLPRTWLAILLLPLAASASTTIDVSRGPGLEAKPMEVRLLADLPAFTPDTKPRQLSRFGGDASKPARKATGFFRVEKVGERWWMIDPEGRLYFNNAVNAVRPATTGSIAMKTSLNEKFGGVAAWAEQTTNLLRSTGFNGIGAWSEHKSLRAIAQPLPYTVVLNVMANYRRERGGVSFTEHKTGYPEGVTFVFDPNFYPSIRKYLKTVTTDRKDPWIVGFFSDNELPFPRDSLDCYLRLSPNEPGFQEAKRWRAAHYGKGKEPPQEIANPERDAFLAHVLATYFGTVQRALKEAFPNHMFLGSRLHGRAALNPDVWAAVAPHVDVISTNIYFQWTPPVERLKSTLASINKPFMTTEWYAKGIDSGLPNNTGAGWLVPTQKDRGRFYQHFLLSLLETGGCVGSHWFCYIDNDPEDPSAGRSNIDSNKGLVNIRHQPYTELTSSMKELNDQVYRVMDYFDTRSGNKGR